MNRKELIVHMSLLRLVEHEGRTVAVVNLYNVAGILTLIYSYSAIPACAVADLCCFPRETIVLNIGGLKHDFDLLRNLTVIDILCVDNPCSGREGKYPGSVGHIAIRFTLS